MSSTAWSSSVNVKYDGRVSPAVSARKTGCAVAAGVASMSACAATEGDGGGGGAVSPPATGDALALRARLHDPCATVAELLHAPHTGRGPARTLEMTSASAGGAGALDA